MVSALVTLCPGSDPWRGCENMNTKLITAFVAVFIIGVVSLVSVIAYRGNPEENGPNYDADVHEQLEAAIEAGDYDAWLEIRTENNLPMKGRMFQVITEENFDRYVALHEANEAGDTVTADAIRAELGLGQGAMKRNGGQAGTGCAAHGGAGSCRAP